MVSNNLRVTSGHVLRANISRNDGTWVKAALDLNRILGNFNGMFTANYSKTARNIMFNPTEGTASVPALRAELADIHGYWRHHDVNLEDRLKAENGWFCFDGNYSPRVPK
ncbi:Cyanovirin-N [Tothia fuscella]|uniref:Cyanovirin-N n=1 Tax=Tothia fuscella TaxID=1048955 RepID=A0A9P4NT10_9PEZI|nr:Cyanovirin-N [Tothia fuscella]